MPLPQRKLKTLAKYCKLVFVPLREFDNGTGHPVVMMRESHLSKKERGDYSWVSLMCPCDLKWRWEMFGLPPQRAMVMTGNSFGCSAKEDAREVVRAEIRATSSHLWAVMSPADAVFDIWQKHCAGEYMGEHNPGTLYVQDIERLLGTTPEVINLQLGEGKNAQGEVVSPPRVEHIAFPSRTILAGVEQLQKRKLLDLNGMILVPYRESFRLPETLHRQLKYWIEEPLGWPNGDAGEGFTEWLYNEITKASGWTKGEDVFGDEYIPDLSGTVTKQDIKRWYTALDPRLMDPLIEEKHTLLNEITLERWIAWLTMIREEIHKKG